MKVPKLNDTPARTNCLTIKDFLNWMYYQKCQEKQFYIDRFSKTVNEKWWTTYNGVFVKNIT